MDSSRLIAYVHVPKTAGSSVNKSLASFGRGLAHFENFSENSGASRLLSDCTWVSGHIPIGAFEELLSRFNITRIVEFYSSVRNPLDQVRSHYNWLIEIYHKGEDFYSKHPDHIKEVSETLRKSNRSSPRDVVDNLRRFSGLFMNIQSLCVLGAREQLDPEELKRRLSKYSFISTENNIDVLLDQMSGGITLPSKRENVSSYHFDPRLFETEEVVSFLKNAGSADFSLYEEVKARW